MSLNINEMQSSQIPALQLLAKLGYEIMSPSKAFKARGSSLSNVLLDDILRAQLSKINRIHYKGQEYPFSEANIHEAIQKLKNLRYDGRVKIHEAIDELITLPVALKQTFEGHSRSYDLNYIDWKDIKNNVFHAVPEFVVERAHTKENVRPDIVLFVNGIPLCVIECKSPNVEVKEAISQNIRNQKRDYIPQLFAYVQLILATNGNAVRYATTETQYKFWSEWRELEYKEKHIQALINKPLSTEQKNALFSDEFASYRKSFKGSDNHGSKLATEQDKAIYSLCRPERLLDLACHFTVFEDGEKKIARYQQFFVVRNALKRVKQYRGDRREGGIIWHTQGSGKSLTMVMLVRALMRDAEIVNPRILLVTDRTDLDEQLGNTFEMCGLNKAQATSGRNLVKHLKEKTSIITTLIHKFDQALEAGNYVDESADIFALVDESHRTNFAFFATRMRQMLPNACYIGFTGTPLLKEEKNSFRRFGRLIEPHYSIDQAVKDKAILPLLYESRLDDIKQNKEAMDLWFERITTDLTPDQKADLKRKKSRANMLKKSDPVIYERAFNISRHFERNWQISEFKAQLVAPSKVAAIKYHNYLEEIGQVSSDVIMSPPDMRKGYEKVGEDSTDEVLRFWKMMMDEYGSAEEYEKSIINKFKEKEHPEIIIVVDKLLTGFNAPRNTVLYLCKSMREHTLLQAIARVNRLHGDKEFGYIIDYECMLKELDKSLTMYDALEGFDEEDIAEALVSVNKEVEQLPQKYSELWAIFKGVDKNDQEAMERSLGNKEKRDEFYECLTAYANTLGIALSTDKFLREVSDEDLNRYRKDLKNLIKLRQSVQLRYAEKIDFGVYEKKIEKLLDTHIQAGEVGPLNPPTNIHDQQARRTVMEESPTYESSMNSIAAKADAIAHATKKTIKEKMGKDPAFYKKFSALIQDAINDFENQKISEAAYFNRVKDYKKKVDSNIHDDAPENIKDNSDACAYYGVIKLQFEKSTKNELAEKVAAETSLFIQTALKKKQKVDFWYDIDAQKSVENDIDDYLHDVVKAEFNIPLDDAQMDDIISQVMLIAKNREHAR